MKRGPRVPKPIKPKTPKRKIETVQKGGKTIKPEVVKNMEKETKRKVKPYAS